MSYIQVCLQSAKSIQHYATDPLQQFHLKKGEKLEVPFYLFSDGKERSKECQDILFERIGHYKVRSTLHATSKEFELKWTKVGQGFGATNCVTVPRTPNCWQEDEVAMVFFPNLKHGIRIIALQDITLYKMMVMVEYLDL